MYKRNVAVSLTVLLAAVGLVCYRQFLADHPVRVENTSPVAEEFAHLRELSTVVTYDVPGKDNTIRFSVFLDEEGRIQEIRSLDTNDPDHQDNVDEFNATLLTTIKGKKLSELEAVDKVGTSSLTTEAFNTGLDDLKAQI